MAYLGSWKIDDFLTFYVNSHATTGAATDADGVPPYRIYEDETGAAIANANMALLDAANTAGFYSERIQLQAVTGYEKGKQYVIYISVTVGGIEGTQHHTFQIEAEVDANTVSDGVDVTSISGDAAAANNLETAYDGGAYNVGGGSIVAASVTGAVGSVTGAVGSVTGNVGGNVVGTVASVTGNLGGNVNGNVVGSVGSVVGAVGSVTGAVGSVTGNVGGNVTGSVGSVVAEVDADVTAISGDAAAANNLETAYDGGAYNTGGGAIVAASVTGAVGSVTGAVGSVTGNVGGNVVGNVNGNVVGSVGSVVGAVGSVTGAVGSVTGNVGGNVTGSVGSVAAGGIAAASYAAGAITAAAIAANAITSSELATDAIGAAQLATSAVDEIVDQVWNELIAGHLGAGSTGAALNGASAPTVGQIADAVWDELIAGHLGAGSTGASLNAAGGAGDPWITALPGAYAAGSAGDIIGNLEADTCSCVTAWYNKYISVLTNFRPGGAITIRRGDTFTLNIERLGDITTRADIWFTVKEDQDDADTASWIQISETVGLEYINGLAATVPANGSITVIDAVAGDVTIVLAAVECAKLQTCGKAYYDIQVLFADGTVSTLVANRVAIVRDSTRVTS